MVQRSYLFFLFLTLLSLLTISSVFAFFPIQTNPGFSLKGQETRIIDNDQIINGDITLSDDAVLTIKNATVIVANSGGTRTYIQMRDNAKLILENATVWPLPLKPHDLEIFASGNSKIEITNSTYTNAITLIGNASVTGNNAKIYSSTGLFSIEETDSAFGVIQPSQNSSAEFTNSIVGSFALNFSHGDKVVISNLKPQIYKDFNLQRDSNLSSGFNIILKDTEVLPVKAQGAFERGWTIYTDPNAKIEVRDSSLNKFVFQTLKNETLTFKDLKINTPQLFDFRDIHLTNTVIENQWGFWGEDSNITIENSDGVWLWPIGTGKWELKKSRMNEFDPRIFVGELIFDNSTWEFTGEVFENTNMKLKGTVKITEDLVKSLAFADSIITREYPIKFMSKKKRMIKLISIDVFDGSKNLLHTETKDREAFISLPFTQENYKKSFQMKVAVNGKIKKLPISFFTSTPIIVKY